MRNSHTYETFDVEDISSPPAFHAKLTTYVFLTCVVAASGGILFGENTLRMLGCLTVGQGVGWLRQST